MNETNHKVGYFVFSLDTELAWGSLWNQPQLRGSSWDGAVERKTVQRLLNMMDEFGILATWAITGHLFYEKCEECVVCPMLELKGRDNRFEQIWMSSDPIWYGADLVDELLSRDAKHEIAFHGYTHRTYDRLNRDEARFEIQEWLRLAKRKDISPKTVIFPQGKIRHLDLFQEAGFICYRGKEVRHPASAIPFLGKVINQINLRLSILTPQVYEIEADPSGLVNIPSSQWLFRTHRSFAALLDSLNLRTIRLRSIMAGIDRAAREQKVIHLWAHPHEFRTEKDFGKLRFVFECFAEQAKAGRMQSITMATLAQQTLRRSGRGSTLLEKATHS